MIERVCDKCGKVFCPAPYHAYKEGSRIYCTWHCYNHRNDGKPKKEVAYKVVEAYDKSGQLIRTYKSVTAAAEHTGFALKNIQRACHDGAVYNGFIWKYKV